MTQQETRTLIDKLEELEDLEESEVRSLAEALLSGELSREDELRLLSLWQRKSPSQEELAVLVDVLAEDLDTAPGESFDIAIEHSGASRLITDRLEGSNLEELEGGRPRDIWPLATALVSEAGLTVCFATPYPDTPLVRKLRDNGVHVESLEERISSSLAELFAEENAALLRLLALLADPRSATPRLAGVADSGWPQKVVSVDMGSGRKSYAIAGGEGFDRASTIARSKLTMMHDGLAFTLDLEPGRYKARDDRLEDQLEDAPEEALNRLLCGDSSSPLARAVALNAALALELSGEVNHLIGGVERTMELIESGVLGRWFA